MTGNKSNASIFSPRFTLNINTIHFILYSLFFLSGVAALIYQVMWQRLLFTVFGVDLTSVTIIVSVFMFGLGLGGLVGGYIADKFTAYALMIYMCIEAAIAIFGFCSPVLIENIGTRFFSSSQIMTG